MIEIEVRSPAGETKRHAFAAAVVRIGRSASNDLSLPDNLLSRQHAEIREREGGWFLADLASRNGTQLNGAPVRGEQRLEPGDRIRLGDFQIVFAPEETTAEGEGAAVEAAFPAQRIAAEIDTDPDFGSGEAGRQDRALAILTRAASALLAHRPLEEMFRFVLDQIFHAIPADRGAILLCEGQPPALTIRASRSREGPAITRVSQSIARRVIDQRVAILLRKVMEDPDLRSRDSISSLGIRSALCAPLWLTGATEADDQVIGLLYLDKQSDSETFAERDLRLLSALANIAASKIEQSRRLEETLQRRRLEEDLARAAQIQLALLPERAPSLPGCDLSGSSTPCLAVGGDYYDFGLDAGALNVAVGDVAGKGTAAALLTTMLRSAVRAHWKHQDVAEAVRRINLTVAESTPEFRYITFFLARFEPGSGQLTYVNAGHNAPLLVRRDGAYERLDKGGTVLGLFEASQYETGRLQLAPGEVLVAFSDGVSEADDGRGGEFGEAGIASAVRAVRDGSADEIRCRILDAARDFSRGASPGDDRTLVVLKRRPF